MFRTLALLLWLTGFAASAQQPWPTKPIRLVVANSAGAATDVAGRVFADQLARRLERPVTVENRPGGDGLVGAQAVVAAAPDGYTLFLASQSTFAIDPNLRKSMPFDPVRDFTAIAVVFDDTGPSGIFAHPSQPFTTLTEMVQTARSQPGRLAYATTVPIFSMLGEWIQRRAGITLTEVPYKSTPQATQDAIAGQVPLYINAYGTVEQHVRSGKLRALALTVRQPDLASIPGIAEVFPGFSMMGAIVLLGPAGLPADIAQRLNRETDAVVRNPQFNEMLKSLRWQNVEGARSVPGTAEFMRALRERWAQFIAEAGRRPE